MIDEQKIEQVLWNVTLNAIQASPSESKIFFNIFQKDGGIEIKIQDEGQGIPETNLDKIFHPFFSTRVHGSGLGLAISKKIIDMHKGKMTIESSPGKGTTVLIFLQKGRTES